MNRWVGKLFGIEDLASIHDWNITFAASWAQQAPVLVFFAAAGAFLLGMLYYLRYQRVARHIGRDLMALCRAAALAFIALILAQPVIALRLSEYPKPLFIALFDGSDSMNIKDGLAPDTVKRLQEATGAAPAAVPGEKRGRAEPAGLAAGPVARFRRHRLQTTVRTRPPSRLPLRSARPHPGA